MREFLFSVGVASFLDSQVLKPILHMADFAIHCMAQRALSSFCEGVFFMWHRVCFQFSPQLCFLKKDLISREA
jgi:hypothetical protein